MSTIDQMLDTVLEWAAALSPITVAVTMYGCIIVLGFWLCLKEARYPSGEDEEA